LITIKKYPNRRLYDTTQSKYVNLDYILQLIEKHRDTKNLLLQIISEQEGDEGRSLLTLTLLKQLIRFYSSDMQPVVRLYLEQSLAGFLEQQETMQHMVKNLVDSSPAGLFGKIMEQNLKLWNIKPNKPGKEDN
jgi:polyhydroxyalkanoate synthesis repressor PhaR